jgi:predicted HTH transcriptional regulator
MTGENRNTIKVRLRDLVNDRYLEKHGSGKGTRYTLGKKA